MGNTQTLHVTGMTCGHCKSAVEESVGAVTGVEWVEADVDAGTVQIAGTVDNDAVVEAIGAAGYDIASDS